MPNSKSTTTVQFAKHEGIATVRFVTEGGIHIFSSRVLHELQEALERIVEDPRVRFIVFRGQGKTFVAGADIHEMSHMGEDEGRAFSKHGHQVFNLIEGLPQATFAAINGHALGAGCELSLACDFRIAVAPAKIGQPESKLGLIPGWGGTQRLPRLVGLAQARRLMFSGEPITADEALRLGLVDEVVPSPDDLDTAIQRWVKLLLGGAPGAVARIKRALAHHDEIEQFGSCFTTTDAKEGIAAFLAKRPAIWMASPATKADSTVGAAHPT